MWIQYEEEEAETGQKRKEFNILDRRGRNLMENDNLHKNNGVQKQTPSNPNLFLEEKDYLASETVCCNYPASTCYSQIERTNWWLPYGSEVRGRGKKGERSKNSNWLIKNSLRDV